MVPFIDSKQSLSTTIYSDTQNDYNFSGQKWFIFSLFFHSLNIVFEFVYFWYLAEIHWTNIFHEIHEINVTFIGT